MWNLDVGAMHTNGYFKREQFQITETKKVAAFFKGFSNKDIYLSCYRYVSLPNNKKLLMGAFYLDFDCNIESDFAELKESFLNTIQAIEKLYDLNQQHYEIYFSGAKGFHLIIPSFNIGFTADQDLNVFYKYIASFFKKNAPFIDTKIYDDRRVFRVANSINSKTSLYKVCLTKDNLLTFNYENLKEYAKTPHDITGASYITTDQFYQNQTITSSVIDSMKKEEQALLNSQKRNLKTFKSLSEDYDCLFPCIDQMLKTVHSEGSRNKILVIIASHFAQKKIDSEDAYDFLANWNLDYNDPPLDEREIRITIKSAYHLHESGRQYGCKAILDTGFCNMACSFGKDEQVEP